MKRVLGATVALILSPLVAAAPAQADTPNCATKGEFKAVEKGWSKTRVANRLDIGGKQTYYFSGTKYSNAMQGRDYKPCTGDYSYISIDFEKKKGVWRVTSKSAYWG